MCRHPLEKASFLATLKGTKGQGSHKPLCQEPTSFTGSHPAFQEAGAQALFPVTQLTASITERGQEKERAQGMGVAPSKNISELEFKLTFIFSPAETHKHNESKPLALSSSSTRSVKFSFQVMVSRDLQQGRESCCLSKHPSCF